MQDEERDEEEDEDYEKGVSMIFGYPELVVDRGHYLLQKTRNMPVACSGQKGFFVSIYVKL